jgi:uncharacterized protein (DUF433 family)
MKNITKPTDTEIIQKTAGVCGGDGCIRNTRIAVWMLVALKKQGASEERILRGYPDLTHEDLNAAWDYFRDYSEEIEKTIFEQEMEF